MTASTNETGKQTRKVHPHSPKKKKKKKKAIKIGQKFTHNEANDR